MPTTNFALTKYGVYTNMNFKHCINVGHPLCKVSRLRSTMLKVFQTFFYLLNLVGDRMHKTSKSGDFEEQVVDFLKSGVVSYI